MVESMVSKMLELYRQLLEESFDQSSEESFQLLEEESGNCPSMVVLMKCLSFQSHRWLKYLWLAFQSPERRLGGLSYRIQMLAELRLCMCLPFLLLLLVPPCCCQSGE